MICIESLFVNCPTVICSPNMLFLIGETLLVNCGPRSILLYLNTFYCFYCSLQTNTIFHSIRLILCFQQAVEIDKLTVMLGQSILIVLCRFQLWRRNPWCCAALHSFTNDLHVAFISYWFDKPWFLTEGKLAAVRIIPSSWGSQRTCVLHAISYRKS